MPLVITWDSDYLQSKGKGIPCHEFALYLQGNKSEMCSCVVFKMNIPNVSNISTGKQF